MAEQGLLAVRSQVLCDTRQTYHSCHASQSVP
jgi:hypothetical protein